jgi:hypothetical protein
VHRFLQVLSAENMVRLKIEPLATPDNHLQLRGLSARARRNRTQSRTSCEPNLIQKIFLLLFLRRGVLSEIAKQTADKMFAIFGFDLQFVPTR